ncbi:MAG TPA: tetratricopeptide repeat protein, partial [Bacillota bacterium]|nr:tetratricopeptide repeat protein [Bacillota bacterium]
GASDPVYEWELAKASIELDRYDDALNHYEDAYNTLNQDSEFLKEYGYFLVEEGMTEKAIAILEKYLVLESQDEEVREYLFRMKDTFDRS